MLQKRKIILTVLTAIMTFAFSTTLFASEFSDIENHWAEDEINHLVSLEIMNDSLVGADEFLPNKKITRGETVELVLKVNLTEDLLLSAIKNVSSNSTFPDVGNHELKKYIDLSKEFEIINGYEDGTFKADGEITREEFAAILVRSQEFLGKLGSSSDLSFSDVKTTRWSYDYIYAAAEGKIVNGYPDKTFLPANNITWAEAYTMIDNYYNACFVNYDGVVGYAVKDGEIISGATAKLVDLSDDKVAKTVTTNKFGQFRFDTTDSGDYKIEITSGDFYGELSKITLPLSETLIESEIVLEKTDAEDKDDEKVPVKYTLTVKAGDNGKIITGASGSYEAGEKISIEASEDTGYTFDGWTSSKGGTFADKDSLKTTFEMPESDTTITANFIETVTLEQNYISLDGVTISIGDTLTDVKSKLGTQDRIDPSNYEFDWYVFNSDYSKFIMVGIKDDVVEGIYTNSKGFETNNAKYGDKTVTAQSGIRIYQDGNDSNKVHACLVISSDAKKLSNPNTDDFFKAQELENIDAVNAFRVNHGLGTLEEDSIATKTARDHSQDMADRNFFSHDTPEGVSPWDRFKNNGGTYTGVGENIYAGNQLGIDAFDGWVNSSGHRDNMLGDFKYIGVGYGYNTSSSYSYYMTQFFFKK